MIQILTLLHFIIIKYNIDFFRQFLIIVSNLKKSNLLAN